MILHSSCKIGESQQFWNITHARNCYRSTENFQINHGSNEGIIWYKHKDLVIIPRTVRFLQDGIILIKRATNIYIQHKDYNYIFILIFLKIFYVLFCCRGYHGTFPIINRACDPILYRLKSR